MQFKVQAREMSAGSLNNLLNPAGRRQSWYKVLSVGSTCSTGTPWTWTNDDKSKSITLCLQQVSVWDGSAVDAD